MTVRTAVAAAALVGVAVAAAPSRAEQPEAERQVAHARGRCIIGSMRELLARRAEFVGFVQKRLGRKDVAEDLVQEALARSVAKLGDVAEESQVAWFYQVLRNAIIDHVRKEGTEARTKEGWEAEADLVEEVEEPKRPCCCAAKLVDELKPEYAEALKKVEMGDTPVKDYAQEAGITSGNAAVRVFRARESLKKAVVRTCGSCCSDGGHNYCTCAH